MLILFSKKSRVALEHCHVIWRTGNAYMHISIICQHVIVEIDKIKCFFDGYKNPASVLKKLLLKFRKLKSVHVLRQKIIQLMK